MANTSAVYARIDSNLKDSAEGILHQLGITPSSAIQMLYSQIVLTKSFPLDLQLHYERPTSINNMTREELNSELEKGLASIEKGRTYTAEEVNRIMREKFNL